ncbi:hypothetical protein H7F15_16135 [Pontibacter sp. Tf4]|uniref:hypothetical protein n=1 Tax=Pontibacter sp. Tf4 TaxID=2761620 RepID=UPI001628CAC1|nr:hypothetical protein [Pontibacter sp. Tf4]MBB6612574.1 hypothetical protein [Pontibacter sp. Tf4]
MYACKLYSLVLTLLLLSACSGPAPDRKATETNAYDAIKENFNPDWAMDKLWDDGLAEVAIYDAERVVYGKKREFEFTLITVKEDFNREHNVKTDNYNRDDLFPVMKVNEFCRIPTDNYPYHYLTSVFVHRGKPWQLHKLTTSSQEWCGNTFKSVTDEGNNYSMYYNSYFDGQGEGNRQLTKALLFEDQLPYSLRALRFRDGLRFNADIAETQQTNKATAPAVYKATIQVNSTSTGNGTDEEEKAWQVNVQLAPNKVNSYWFSTEYPNKLIRQRTWDGRNLELKKISRYAYWQGD